jgi:MoaA/NifB/PqqE/SkfB family radical SAM enzyme
MSQRIEKFIWDLTYACPLRCVHCYSESGRRASRMLDREDAMRVVDVILAAQPERMSLSGGEPLLVPWAVEVARRLHDAGVVVTLFTSGWVLTERLGAELASSIDNVAVSVDGPSEEIHDRIRGRPGAFQKAMAALGILQRVKRERLDAGQECYTFGIDYTVTQSGYRPAEIEQFIEDVTSRFPDLGFVRFGAAIPSGLAAERRVETTELLTIEQLLSFNDARERFAARARNGVAVSVTDVRYFLPATGSAAASDVDIALIEPDGALRAVPIYEAKIGNVLEEPLDALWPRAMAWRSDPFVVAEIGSIQTMADWARVTRTLDQRYGSAEDRVRIARRGAPVRPGSRPESASTGDGQVGRHAGSAPVPLPGAPLA